MHEKYIKWLKHTHWRIHAILTVYGSLITSIPNAIHLPFGSTCVSDWENIDLSKMRMKLIIASDKRFLPGHVIRHDLVKWMLENNLEIDIIGRGYRPNENKWEGLAPYRYSVVIENTVEKSYFREKLIEAILCETTPIYLGCQDIDNYHDTSGMIICKTVNDLKNAVLSASINQYRKTSKYNSIKRKAAWYGEYDKSVAHAVFGVDGNDMN